MRGVRPCLTAVLAAVFATAGCGANDSAGVPWAEDEARAPIPRTAPPSTSAPTASKGPIGEAGNGPSPETSAVSDRFDSTRDADADIRTALATAAQSDRAVLIDFGANWCPDCRVLHHLFRSPQVAPLLARNYVVVRVDVGEFDHNLDVAARYIDLTTSGIPALAVLAPDGSVRTATNDGALANARDLDPGQVAEFLTRWAPGDAGRK
ncbi:thioredoxin family protein [Embleya sp. NPDC020630]|uniref:thioredoxin family protein n=1 Tax=Embleya sp. NPDC020630 TaxID=3363979 RepID=UPI003791D1F5